MNQFEDDLRKALRRAEPPAGFAKRVLDRTGPSSSTPRAAKWLAAAMAACLLLAAGRFEYRQYEGRKAKRELLLALEITGNKLSIAQGKVFDLSRRTIHD